MSRTRRPVQRRLRRWNRTRIGLRIATVACIVVLPTLSVATLPIHVAGALTAPTVSCQSNQDVFNTGYDATSGGVLSDGSQDANWQVAGPFDTPDGASPPTSTSAPPSSASFAAANVGNLVKKHWAATPYQDAQWISQQTLSSRKQPDETGDWYYQFQFMLDPSVDPSSFTLDAQFLADNEIAEVYVNGVAQSPMTTGLPQAPTTANPYKFKGFESANSGATVLDHSWQAGSNTIDVEVKSSYPYEGIDAQVTEVCPVGLSVTKTATPNPYVPGETLTYTINVANAGPGPASGVTVSDQLPTALQNAGFTWTCIASTGSSCTTSGSGSISDTANVAAGGSLTYTVTGTVPASTTGTLTNSVTVTPASGESDPGCSPSCSATSTDPGSAVVVASQPSGSLAFTGFSSTLSSMSVIGALSTFVGGLLVAITRPRRQHHRAGPRYK